MVAEGDHRGDQRRRGQLEHTLEQVAMAAVHSIENADGDDGFPAGRGRSIGKGLAKAATAKGAGSRVFRS